MQEPIKDPRNNALYTMPGTRRRIDWPLLALAFLLALFALVGTDEFRTAQVEQQTYQQR